ncbi:hypothetical protein Taro_049988 [Colocasia esculenta]|uniref:Uncharacterized protein n=1 Tax=Colocasia esculenta TaxID=4460 RepID=A0A843XCK4_COLES|nr:hypothetical protein [Colocasia esculenta]
MASIPQFEGLVFEDISPVDGCPLLYIITDVFMRDVPAASLPDVADTKQCARSRPLGHLLARANNPFFSSDVMLCNTAEVLEPTGMTLLRKNIGVPLSSIESILPLKTRASSRRARKVLRIALEAYIEWLDVPPPRSILYVSFGS